jgi:hypothetical protein
MYKVPTMSSVVVESILRTQDSVGGRTAEYCDAPVTEVNSGLATGRRYASVMSYSVISLPVLELNWGDH